MTTASEAFKAGDIGAAIAAQQQVVKSAPRDAGARWFLAELLLFAGEAERADRMLDAAVLDDPSPAVLEFRRLLRAEVVRQQVWAEGRAPKFSSDSATTAQLAVLRATVSARAGQATEAAAAAQEAEAARPRVTGQARMADGSVVAFDDLRDLDDVLAPMLEVLTTGGDHMLVPFERVATLEFDPPRRPRDLAWRRTAITLRDGTEGVVYVPTIYAGAADATDALRLGRETEWVETAGLTRGRGQRLLLLGEEAVAITDIAALDLEAAR